MGQGTGIGFASNLARADASIGPSSSRAESMQETMTARRDLLLGEVSLMLLLFDAASSVLLEGSATSSWWSRGFMLVEVVVVVAAAAVVVSVMFGTSLVAGVKKYVLKTVDRSTSKSGDCVCERA